MTARPTTWPISRTSRPWCSPGFPRPLRPVAPPSASRCAKAAKRFASLTWLTSRRVATNQNLNKKFAESLELDFPILSDPTKDVATAYGVVNETRPNPFRWTFYIGKDGKLLFVDKDVKSATHGDHIAEKLAELGVAKK